jgi:hypothetical protein
MPQIDFNHFNVLRSSFLHGYTDERDVAANGSVDTYDSVSYNLRANLARRKPTKRERKSSIKYIVNEKPSDVVSYRTSDGLQKTIAIHFFADYHRRKEQKFPRYPAKLKKDTPPSHFLPSKKQHRMPCRPHVT